MTPGQLRCLNFIREFVARNTYSPSYAEIAEGIGLRSKSGVHRLIHALRQSGHIKAERLLKAPAWSHAKKRVGGRSLVASGECPYCGRQPL